MNRNVVRRITVSVLASGLLASIVGFSAPANATDSGWPRPVASHGADSGWPVG